MKQPNGFRLNLITIALTVLLIVACILNYLLSQDMHKSHTDKTALTLNSNRFLEASSYLTNEVRAYASTGNEIHYDNYYNEVNVYKNRDISLAKMLEIGITDKELDIIEEMSSISNSLIPLELSAMEDVKKGDCESAMEYVYGYVYYRDVSNINALKDEFIATLNIRTSSELSNITLKSDMLQISLCIFTLLIILMQVINYKKNKAMLHEFERLASIDIFSGLYNRNKYIQTLEQIVVDKPDTIGVVYLDINGLKQVNDEYGHEHGNELILKVVGKIKECFTETLFRIGGDEFVILCFNGDRVIFENKVLQLRNATNIHENATVSIGSTWCTDANDIFKQIVFADELMFVDKQNYFSDRQFNRKNYRSSVAADLCSAIEANEFIILLQPKVLLTDGTIVGAEALSRKIGAQGKLISPDQFIPIYESDGIIQYLDYYVLDTVCKLLKSWLEIGHPLIPISVNFSRITILEYNVAQKIDEICKKHNIQPKYIVIELTEHIGNILTGNLNSIINEIQSLGFKVSLDDFGREYSNLAVLAHVPFDEIKIDKNLIDDIVFKPEISTAIQHIVGMCNSYRKTEMVVEGIETYEQLKILRELDCKLNVGQGFYFSKPLSVEMFLQQYIAQSFMFSSENAT